MASIMKQAMSYLGLGPDDSYASPSERPAPGEMAMTDLASGRSSPQRCDGDRTTYGLGWRATGRRCRSPHRGSASATVDSTAVRADAANVR